MKRNVILARLTHNKHIGLQHLAGGQYLERDITPSRPEQNDATTKAVELYEIIRVCHIRVWQERKSTTHRQHLASAIGFDDLND